MRPNPLEWKLESCVKQAMMTATEMARRFSFDEKDGNMEWLRRDLYVVPTEHALYEEQYCKD